MYPRRVKLDHPKLLKLELEKGELIEQGREFSRQIEETELEMGKIDIRLQAQEAKVDVADLKEKGKAIIKDMDNVANEFKNKIQAVEKEIFERMSKQTDPELRKKHQELEKIKKDLETERNKKALKAQQIKDRIIPLTRRLMTPHLENDYEDIYDVKLENGEMIGTIFSHLADFETKFRKKLEKSKK